MKRILSAVQKAISFFGNISFKHEHKEQQSITCVEYTQEFTVTDFILSESILGSHIFRTFRAFRTNKFHKIITNILGTLKALFGNIGSNFRIILNIQLTIIMNTNNTNTISNFNSINNRGPPKGGAIFIGAAS